MEALTIAYKVAKPQGQGSDCFSDQRPQHIPVSWKPETNRTNQKHEQSAYEFLLISLNPQWIVVK